MKNLATFGADPEFFLVDTYTASTVPAFEIIPETDKNHHLDIGNGFNVHADNAALEFNFPPESTPAGLRRVVNTIIPRAERWLRFLGAEHRYLSLSDYIVGEFDAESLDNDMGRTIGCDPDFNAYTEMMNPQVDIATLGNTRVAGGHLHLGTKGGLLSCKEDYFSFARSVDLLVRNSELLNAFYSEKLPEIRQREKTYGAKGAFRPKPEYPGIEYRSVSNMWIFNVNIIFQGLFSYLDNKPFLYDEIKQDRPELLERIEVASKLENRDDADNLEVALHEVYTYCGTA